MSAKLEAIFANVNGGSFVSIDTLTAVPLTGGKKNEMQGRVTKLTTGASVMVFQNKTTNAYENMVNRRLVAEGKDPASFVLGERAWGVRRKDSPFIDHNDTVYLEVIYLRAPKKVEYFLDGEPIDKKDVVGLKETEASDESQGGLNNKVIVRSYKADSIKAVRIDGEEFVL